LIIDTHSELQADWRAVVQRGRKVEEVTELGRAPLSETEAFQLATNQWKNAEFRNLKKIEWQTWAQKRYRAIAKGSAARVENVGIRIRQ